MNFLETILARKREEVASRKRALPVAALMERPAFGRIPISLAGALLRHRPAVIAELKKASPSRSTIREEFDPLPIAAQLESNGASALSVLTDTEFFQGSIAILEQLRPAVSLPLLRKDFIIDEYQVYETKAAGADALLLIVAALDREKLLGLKDLSDSLGLECLVEVHDEKDIETLAGCRCTLIGVNNRDLTSFSVDLGTSYRLRAALPPGSITVSESGISTSRELKAILDAGYHAALIGESLMKAEKPGEALASLLEGVEAGV